MTCFWAAIGHVVPGGGGGGGDPHGAPADYPVSAGFAPGGAQTLPLLKTPSEPVTAQRVFLEC